MSTGSNTTSRLEHTVIVTGGARGQGVEHARALGHKGFNIMITDILDAQGKDTEGLLKSEGIPVVYRPLDVTSETAWQELARDLSETGVRVKGLVNNAGVLRYASIADTTLDIWRLQEQVNVHGTFLGIKHLSPLLAKEHGSVVNVSSTAALSGSSGYASYASSKASVIALTKVAAVELAPSVRVNVICPGGVLTPMNADEPTGGTSSGAPLGRRAHPREISPMVSYLITEDSSFVTGSVFTIDGGLTAT